MRSGLDPSPSLIVRPCRRLLVRFLGQFKKRFPLEALVQVFIVRTIHSAESIPR